MDPLVSVTDDYLSILLGLPHLTPLTLLAAFFLTMARLLPIMVMAPFFGSKLLPAPIKIMFASSLAILMLPQILVNLHGPLSFNAAYTGFALKEIFIGFILGFMVTIPFYIAQSSGSLIDHIRGSSSLQVTDPTTSIQSSPVGIFYNYVLIAVFFAVGGPFLFMDAINHSFQLVPINQWINPLFFSSSIPFWKTIFGLLNYVLKISIQLGAPSIVGILMGEMFLGIANRLAPQVQIVFLGIPLKSWLGLALLAIAWYFIIGQLSKESIDWVKTIDATIRNAAPIVKPTS